MKLCGQLSCISFRYVVIRYGRSWAEICEGRWDPALEPGLPIFEISTARGGGMALQGAVVSAAKLATYLKAHLQDHAGS